MVNDVRCARNRRRDFWNRACADVSARVTGYNGPREYDREFVRIPLARGLRNTHALLVPEPALIRHGLPRLAGLTVLRFAVTGICGCHTANAIIARSRFFLAHRTLFATIVRPDHHCYFARATAP
jgi:hypothetical protein